MQTPRDCIERDHGEPGRELLIRNGSVITLDLERPRAQALLLRDGLVVATGDDAEVVSQASTSAQELDLAGGCALPGFTDAHLHLDLLGAGLESVDLRGCRSAAELVGRLRDQAPPEGWVVGRNWDDNLGSSLGRPVREVLDEAYPDRPVWLVRVDVHSGWGNGALIENAGITATTPDPVAGEIARDAEGRATGLLIDRAMDLVALEKPDGAARERRLLAVQQHLHQRGVTGAHHMSLDDELDDSIRGLTAANSWHVRTHAYARPETFEERYAGAPYVDPSVHDMYTVCGVKLFADGAFGSRGAWLLEPYTDRPGATGVVLDSEARIERYARLAIAGGWQVATHAIGDAALRAVLGAYERVLASAESAIAGVEDSGGPSAQAEIYAMRSRIRCRVEHCAMLTDADVARLADLRLVASCQPTFVTSDMPWLEERLGSGRMASVYRWNSLAEAGIPICFGSDAPVEEVDVLRGMHAAITRQTVGGFPAAGYLPRERARPAVALNGYTAAAAYAVRREKQLGILKPGFAADVTCLSQDPTTIGVEGWPLMEPSATIVAGSLVWSH